MASDLLLIVAGTALALAVCYPFLRHGELLLLDWSLGQDVPIVPTSAFGLSGGLTTGTPELIAVGSLSHVLGPTLTWLPILLFFPAATFSMGRLIKGRTTAKLAGGLLYAVNPFVFNRIYVGHISLLVGYALLPIAIRSAHLSWSERGPRRAIPALWWAGLTALSPHYAWIFGIVLLAMFVCVRPFNTRHVKGFIGTILLYSIFSLYIVLPHLATQLPATVGSIANLSLYQTTPDPRFGLLINVLGMYGFWRTGPGPELPKNIESGWPFLLVAIYLIAILGFYYLHRTARGPTRPNKARSLGVLFIVLIGILGILLAMGAQGPTGGLFRVLYLHVPFFNIMEEPQKFLILECLAVSVLFGSGVEYLASRPPSERRLSSTTRHLAWPSMLGLLVLLPLAYTPTMVGALDGQLSISTLPASWQQADDLMGTGPGQILFLPWHLYMEFPFTYGRVVANPSQYSFRRSVIYGDNLEVQGTPTESTSPRSAYIQHLLDKGASIHAFGELVAPLGVEFVVLAKTADWVSYRWLNRQSDLKSVINTTTLAVWVNQSYSGTAEFASRVTNYASTQSLIESANRHISIAGSVISNGPSTKLLGNRAGPAFDDRNIDAHVHELSPVSYDIGPGYSGWMTVDVPYQPGWSFDSQPTKDSAEGTVLFRLPKSGGVLRFQPWGSVVVGSWLSGGSFSCICVSTIIASYRRRRAGRRGSPEQIPPGADNESACDTGTSLTYEEGASNGSREPDS